MAHDLIVVVLGTEDSMERGRVSGLLARYAMQVFQEGGESSAAGTKDHPEYRQGLPIHAEAAVECIVRDALREDGG